MRMAFVNVPPVPTGAH